MNGLLAVLLLVSILSTQAAEGNRPCKKLGGQCEPSTRYCTRIINKAKCAAGKSCCSIEKNIPQKKNRKIKSQNKPKEGNIANETKGIDKGIKGNILQKKNKKTKSQNKSKKARGNKKPRKTVIKLSQKRRCLKQTPKKCKKKGGECVHYKDECKELIGKNLCKGHSCICCKAKTGKEKCKAKKKCSKEGGSCNRSPCHSEQYEIRKGCKGKGCKCCVPIYPCWGAITSECIKKRGFCTHNPNDCNGSLEKGCRGKECQCCVPPSPPTPPPTLQPPPTPAPQTPTPQTPAPKTPAPQTPVPSTAPPLTTKKPEVTTKNPVTTMKPTTARETATTPKPTIAVTTTKIPVVTTKEQTTTMNPTTVKEPATTTKPTTVPPSPATTTKQPEVTTKSHTTTMKPTTGKEPSMPPATTTKQPIVTTKEPTTTMKPTTAKEPATTLKPTTEPATSTAAANPTTELASTSTSTAAKTVRCGIENPTSTRIVNGVDVSVARKYSWQVGVKSFTFGNYYCGGSIITNKHILTAAHCFYDFPQDGSACSRNIPSEVYVGIGDHNQEETMENLADFGEPILAKQVIINPNYSCSTMNIDVAVIELSKSIDLLKHEDVLHPICLPKDDSKTYAGVTATASGWGSTVGYDPFEEKAPVYPKILQEAQIPVLDDSDCKNSISGFTEYMLCAATKDVGYKEGGKDSCQGDSGGPLTVKEGSQYAQIGIVSFGDGCASKGNYGAYTRVTKVLDWIKEQVGSETTYYLP